MHANLPLIATIAMSLTLALIMGYIALKIKLPVIVGYLLAGIIVGPFTPGLEADVDIAQELAEIGIMLLMFGVGLHFSVEDLYKVRKIAIPGALIQMVFTSLLGFVTAKIWGWSNDAAFVFGLCLCVASTVVLLRALEEQDELNTLSGHISVGWLIVEDLAMVIVLILLPAFKYSFIEQEASRVAQPFWMIIGITLAKFIFFTMFMFLGGRRLFPKLLWKITQTGSRELFTLCIIGAAIGIAYAAAQIFDVSFALGAFFSGMIIRESTFSHRAAQDSLPLRDAFAVLFFVSVGMLFDPSVLLTHPFKILIVLSIIVLGKSCAAFFLVWFLKYPLNSALMISISLAQIGEFSFILAELGIHLKLLPSTGRNYILAGALISIAINPLLFRLIEPLKKKIGKKNARQHKNSYALDPLGKLPAFVNKNQLKEHAIVIGYGRVGKCITELISEQSIPFLIIDDNRDMVKDLRVSNTAALYGDASKELVMKEACIQNAKLLMIVVSNLFDARKIIHCARTLNPNLEMIVRTHTEREVAVLKYEKINKVFFAEEEIAHNMAMYLINRYQ